MATGEAGEICVRAPHVMAEYWKRPEQTAETLKNGWLHTGDIARTDERGYMFILDRKKDMIVSGGFNIFPREVEDVLTQHADVAMCRRGRRARRQMGRSGHRHRGRARRRADPNAEELINLVKSEEGLGACAEARPVRQGAADDRRRQGRQEGAEGELLGRARADGGLAGCGGDLRRRANTRLLRRPARGRACPTAMRRSCRRPLAERDLAIFPECRSKRSWAGEQKATEPDPRHRRRRRQPLDVGVSDDLAHLHEAAVYHRRRIERGTRR